MKRAIIVLLVLASVLIAGCQQKMVCNAPYILVGTECCLDADSNSVCDKDEKAEKIINEVSNETEQKVEINYNYTIEELDEKLRDLVGSESLEKIEMDWGDLSSFEKSYELYQTTPENNIYVMRIIDSSDYLTDYDDFLSFNDKLYQPSVLYYK